nr:alkaline phosphatase DedA family protein [uncultured bacterium]
MIHSIITSILHLDVHLTNLVGACGDWSYIILFLAIFAETGLVVTPFLPGDSLLFAAGLLATRGVLDVHVLAILLVIASIIGNTTNYYLGNKLGHLLFKDDNALLFKKSYLDKTHAFYEKYGGKTLILARFIPLVRTYAPFVAGMSQMRFKTFSYFNIISALLWILSILYAGYFFGNIPWVNNNFSTIVLLIIVISIGIPIVNWLRKKFFSREPQQPNAKP